MTNNIIPESLREKRIHTPEFKMKVVLESFQKTQPLKKSAAGMIWLNR